MTAPELHITNLHVERETNPVLHSVTATLGGGAGKLVGLIGPNGAGKSTLLSAIAGLVPVAQGAIQLRGHARPTDDMSIPDMPVARRARIISVLPQHRPTYWSMSVQHVVRLGRYAYGGNLPRTAGDLDHNARAVDAAMAATGITGLQDRPVTDLSGGEQSRVHLARALCAQTPVLLADEPINALDPEYQFIVMRLLRDHARTGRLVIAALHDLSLAARYCDEILVVSSGNKVAQGTPRDALNRHVLETVFGVTGHWSDATGYLVLAPR